MSEPKREEARNIIKTPEYLSNLLQNSEHIKFTDILELSKDILPSTLSEYQKFRFNLFEKEIVRIPILGFTNKKIFCLFTNQNRQTHLELLTNLKDLGYRENDIDFSTSIELGGSGQYLLTLKNGAENDPNSRLSITLGRGSDSYDPQFTESGIKRIEKIFNGEIKQI